MQELERQKREEELRLRDEFESRLNQYEDIL
jgi:hypothetical protein